MRQTIAALLILVVLVAFVAPAAQAGTSTDIALGLASFAVFNQLFAPAFHARRGHGVPFVVREPVVIYRAVPVYAYPGYAYPSYAYPSYAYPSAYPVYPSQYAVVQPPAPMATVVQYPHGRYELRGDGVTVAYRWVWIPNPPPPPPPPASSLPPSPSAPAAR